VNYPKAIFTLLLVYLERIPMLIIESECVVTLDKINKRIITRDITSNKEGVLICANSELTQTIQEYFHIDTSFYGLETKDESIAVHLADLLHQEETQ